MISTDIINPKVIQKLLTSKLQQKLKFDNEDNKFSFKFDKGSSAHRVIGSYIDTKDVDISNTFTKMYFDMLKQENYTDIDWDYWNDCGWGIVDSTNEKIITTIKVRETKSAFTITINFNCDKWNAWLTFPN